MIITGKFLQQKRIPAANMLFPACKNPDGMTRPMRSMSNAPLQTDGLSSSVDKPSEANKSAPTTFSAIDQIMQLRLLKQKLATNQQQTVYNKQKTMPKFSD
jgi:hypothetical protein